MRSQDGTSVGINPWFIAVSVALAAFMEVLDTSIASVALPYISGNLGASTDEGNWVITSYLVSNAVILPIGSWASSVLGRKRFFLICIALFTFSSFLCGIAPSLPLLLLFRVLQGAGGGGLVPVAQAILSDTFPPEKRALAFAFFGVIAVLAPSVGPTLGGWITDNFSWRWIFFINIPVGALALYLNSILVTDPPASRGNKKNLGKIDGIGFGLLAVSMGTLEVFLDKGQEKDWFGSHFIAVLAALFAISTLALVFWEWHNPQPLIKLKLLRHRNFAISCVLIFLIGAVLNTGINLLPLLQQTFYGYTATLAGESVTAAGISLIFLFALAGQTARFVQLKRLAFFGFIAIGVGYYVTSTHIAPQDALVTFARLRLAQVFGLAFLFTSVTTGAYSGFPSEDSNQIAGLTNLLRNIGGSVAISLANAGVTQRSQFHISRLSEHFTPTSAGLQQAAHEQALYLMQRGANQVQAIAMSLGSIERELFRQAYLLSYADVYFAIACLCGVGAFLTLFLDPNDPKHTEAKGE